MLALEACMRVHQAIWVLAYCSKGLIEAKGSIAANSA